MQMRYSSVAAIGKLAKAVCNRENRIPEVRRGAAALVPAVSAAEAVSGSGLGGAMPVLAAVFAELQAALTALPPSLVYHDGSDGSASPRYHLKI